MSGAACGTSRPNGPSGSTPPPERSSPKIWYSGRVRSVPPGGSTFATTSSMATIGLTIADLLRRPAVGAQAQRIVDPRDALHEGEEHRGPEDRADDRAVGHDRRGLGPLHQGRREDPHRAEADGGRQEHDLLPDDVHHLRPAVHQHQAADRDRGHDHQHHEGERRCQLADHDRAGTQGRGDEQVEGLLLALQADLAGGEGWGDDRDQDDLEDRQTLKIAMPMSDDTFAAWNPASPNPAPTAARASGATAR